MSLNSVAKPLDKSVFCRNRIINIYIITNNQKLTG